MLSPLVPIAVLLTLGVTLWKKSTSGVFDEHIVLYVMSFGMAAAKVTNKLVVRQLCSLLFSIFLLFESCYFLFCIFRMSYLCLVSVWALWGLLFFCIYVIDGRLYYMDDYTMNACSSVTVNLMLVLTSA